MSRPEGYNRSTSSDYSDQSSSSAEEESSSTEEEDDEDDEETKDDNKKKNRKKKKTRKVDDGDKCDVVDALKMCLSGETEKKMNHELVQVCGANSRVWKHPDWTGSQPLSYPETPLKYIIDYNHVTDPDTIKKINGIKSNYSWKDALEDSQKRCFRSVPPVDVHLESQLHQVKLTFALPGGDYVNLPKVCENILVASRTKKSYINLSLSADQKQQLYKMLGETIDSSTTMMDTSCNGGYHMFIRDAYVTEYSNNLPISFGGMLVTHDPITNKEKVWCNTKQISNVRSSVFKGTSVVTIPACASQRDIMERMWTVPVEHYHPDVSRFLNVNFDLLFEELQELKTSKAQRVQIGTEPTKAQLKEQGDVDKRVKYSTYEIKMPELTATKTETIIQFIIWERYYDIQLRTSAIPDITPAQEKLYTEYDTSIKGYRLLCVVFDSIVAEYEPYMRHRDYLMSLDGEVKFSMLPERSLIDVEQDIKNFTSDSKAKHYGPSLSVTIQIEFETFQNNAAILPRSSSSNSDNGTTTTIINKVIKRKNKKKDKEKKPKVKSHKKDLLRRTPKSGIIKPPQNRSDYMDQVGDEEQRVTTTTTTTTLDPGTTITTTADALPHQPLMRGRFGKTATKASRQMVLG